MAVLGFFGLLFYRARHNATAQPRRGGSRSGRISNRERFRKHCAIRSSATGRDAGEKKVEDCGGGSVDAWRMDRCQSTIKAGILLTPFLPAHFVVFWRQFDRSSCKFVQQFTRCWSTKVARFYSEGKFGEIYLRKNLPWPWPKSNIFDILPHFCTVGDDFEKNPEANI